MGRLGCLLAALILLVVAWDQYRIEQMRKEIGNISNKLHVQRSGRLVRGTGSDLVTSLAQAESHMRRAKELVKKGKTAQAQAEIDRALQYLQSANKVSTDIAGDAAKFLGQARDRAMKVFQDTWREISEQAKPKKKVDVQK
ncbi:MAG: hypothetical protein QHI38_12555 [Armatimonadota bacterium]|nr:hypothetical protein [Armatimonadota bacterium]